MYDLTARHLASLRPGEFFGWAVPGFASGSGEQERRGDWAAEFASRPTAG